ncbi:MAG: heparan-alpha-glucosaminide N-acetyltransferase domain-containing protein [Patescibacteria group bacterium]
MTSELQSKQITRNIEFDIARAVAIFLMILQHSWLLIFSNIFDNHSWDSFFFTAGTFLVAPVFLFLMGASIHSSRRNTPRQIFKRGLELIILGYGLSALRFYLPIILSQYLGLINSPESIIYQIEPINYLLQTDILHVAGLSLIGLACFKQIKLKLDYYLVIAFLVALASPIFSAASYVIFPFFPWFLYSLVGFYFGSMLVKSSNKFEFYKDSRSKLIPVFILGAFLFLINPIFSPVVYYHHGTGLSLLFISIVIYWLSFIYFNCQKLPEKVISMFTFLSKNVTLIYIIQWLLIAWLAVFMAIRVF